MDVEIRPRTQKPRVHWSPKHGLWMPPVGYTTSIVDAAYNRPNTTPSIVSLVIQLNILNRRYDHA